jgi:hypothetical protein
MVHDLSPPAFIELANLVCMTAKKAGCLGLESPMIEACHPVKFHLPLDDAGIVLEFSGTRFGFRERRSVGWVSERAHVRV